MKKEKTAVEAVEQIEAVTDGAKDKAEEITAPEIAENVAETAKEGETSDNGKAKKKRLRRKDMTPEQKKKRRIKDWIITACVFGTLGVFIAVVALTSFLGTNANLKKIDAYSTVGSTLTPEIDEETGYWTFTTDDEFKVLQLTDVHIGGGAFSLQKDAWAIDAVYTLINRVKPNLVIVTGDIAYPVPFQSGTFDNKREAEVFATLMEKTGVYWAVVFGNHDTEAYSMYTREEIAAFYSQERWSHCLFQTGPENVDGYGNYVINVKNTSNVITHSMYMFDSHSYIDGDYFGAAWKYDNIHQNQVDWYSAQVARMNSINATHVGGAIKSTAYFHIPLVEYRTAWEEYVNNGSQNTADVVYDFGVAGESGKVVYSGIGEDNLFETMLSLGSTVGVFCGHDHLNNFSILYKGIRLTYGMSIDYLAYAGIAKKTAQRGGTVITIAPVGTISVAQELLAK